MVLEIIERDIQEYYKMLKHEHPTEVIGLRKGEEPHISFVNTEEEFINKVKEYNNQGLEVYAGVRDRKNKGDSNIVSSNFIFFEIDEHNMKKPELKQKVEEFIQNNGITITLCVFSGGGYHFYLQHKDKLLLTEEDREIYKKLLLAFRKSLISNGLDIDTAVFDLQRIMRVPGTFNHKRGTMSRIEYANSSNIEENHQKIRDLVLKYDETNEKVDNSASFSILENYGIDKTDKWLYDIIKNQVKIKEDTGGNSIIFKNAAIILTREGLKDEEIKNVGKSLANLCEGRTLTAFMGWINKAKRNELSEVNEVEIDSCINNGEYPLSSYGEKEVEIMPKNKEGTNLRTLKDFKKIKPEKNQIVKDFISPGTLAMLYSPPANFKSLLAESLGISISIGKEWLGLKTKKCPVLLCEGENNDTLLKERFEKISRDLRIKRNPPFYILKGGILMDGKKIINTEFLFTLIDIIEKKKIKVVFFDTMHRYAYYDENKSDDINLLYTKIFQPILEKYKVSIVFLHHSTKSGGYRGSGDFLGMVDYSYSVVRQGKTNKFRIINEKCRSGEIKDISGEIDFGNDYIKLIRLNEVEEKEKGLSKLKEITERIKGLFKNGTELTRKDIIDKFQMDEFDFGSVKTLDRSLKWLYENQYLDKDKKGVYNLILR